MKRKVLQILLAITLFTTSIPVNAFAQDVNALDEIVVSDEADVDGESGDFDIENGGSLDEIAPSEDDEFIEDESLDIEDENFDNNVNSEDETEDLTGAATKGLSDELVSLGYHGFVLNDDMKTKKAELAKVLTEMSEDASFDGVYEANEITFLADSYAEAEQIANCYNAKLDFYDYGVASAVVDFSDEELLLGSLDEEAAEEIPTDIYDVFELSADENNNLPAVYPNFVYSVEDEAVNDEDFDEENFNDEISELTVEDGIESEGYVAVDDGIVSEDYVAADEVSLDNSISAAVSDDPYYAVQYQHDYLKDYVAWNDNVTGKGITVAVIDTGVNTHHVDLKGKIASFKYNPIANNKTYKNYYKYKGTSDAEDDNGHGTHCAGVIGAVKNNKFGGVGVAPDAKIMPIKVLAGNGSGQTAWIVAGVNAATAHGADVFSMSIGGYFYDVIYQEAIAKAISKGIVVVAAMGNDANLGGDYPARYNNVISVGALAHRTVYDAEVAGKNISTDTLISLDRSKTLVTAMYSNSDSSSFKATIAAPGSAIYSTYMRVPSQGNNKDKLMAPMSGTSMATPAISGVVALVLSANKSIKNYNDIRTATAVKQIINAASDKKTYTNPTAYSIKVDRVENGKVVTKTVSIAAGTLKLSNGMVDASKAVAIAKEQVPKPVFTGAVQSEDKKYYISGVGKKLTITGTSGATIYYTLDGKDPIKNGIKISNPGTINLDFGGKKTIKAVAYYLGKYSAVETFSGTFKAPVTSISVTNKISVVPGKSTQILYTTMPSYADKGKMEFSVDKPELFTVNAKGVIKADALATPGATANVTIKDTKSGATTVVKATVAAASITEIKLPATPDLEHNYTMSVLATTLNKGDANETSYVTNINLKSLLKNAGNDVDLLSISSSNPKVLEYKTSDGKLYARKSGSASITIKALDGSNVKKVLKIKVISPIVSMKLKTDTIFYATAKSVTSSITPTQAYIGRTGCKVKISPIYNEGKAYQPDKKFKGVKYESDNPKAVKVSNSGVVTAASGAKYGDSAIISAYTKDGSKLVGKYKFNVLEPSLGFQLWLRYVDINKTKLTDVKTKKLSKLSETVYGNEYNIFDNFKYNNEKVITLNKRDNSNLSDDYLTDFYVTYSLLVNKNNTILGLGANAVNVEKTSGIASNDPSGYKYIFYKLTKRGKQKVTYVPVDGCGKKFVLTLDAK